MEKLLSRVKQRYSEDSELGGLNHIMLVALKFNPLIIFFL